MKKQIKKIVDVGSVILIAGFLIFCCFVGCYKGSQAVENNFAAVYLKNKGLMK